MVINPALLFVKTISLYMSITDLISSESPLRSLETDALKSACCDLVTELPEAADSDENTHQNGQKPPQEGHWWLDPRLVEQLPVNIRKGKDGR